MRLFCSIIVALLLSGCTQREDNNPPPSSSYTMLTVQVDAAQWVQRAPITRAYHSVAASGSMLPLFGSNALLLLEYTDGTDLRAGDIATYLRDDGVSVVHRVREVGNGAVLFGGDNNGVGDGWISKDRIRHRVAGILYSSR